MGIIYVKDAIHDRAAATLSLAALLGEQSFDLLSVELQ